AQDLLDGLDQLAAAIADARIAELAEIGQVLTHLRVCKSKQLAKLRRTGRLQAVADLMLQLAQVKTQAADDGLGNGRLATRICGPLLLFRHAHSLPPAIFQPSRRSLFR